MQSPPLVPEICRTLAVYCSRADEARAEAARVLAEYRDGQVTDEHGTALRDFLRCAHATVWVVSPRDTPVLGARPRSRVTRDRHGCIAERGTMCAPVHVIVAKPWPPRFDARLPRALVRPRAA